MLDRIFPFLVKTISIGNFSVTISVSGILEMILFAILSYYIILWIKRTKAWNLLKGVVVLLVIYILAKFLGLRNVAYIFENFVGSLVIAAIIIFQPEIRRALEQLGNKNILSGLISGASLESAKGLTSESIDAIVRAMESLGRNKVGALIVIERTITLNEFIDTGISLDAKISTALLEQIFEHNTPLHDGAVIIRDNRVISATCYLPLSQNDGISKELGTRHRAGLGISEVSDCITLIASEETGSLSIAVEGRLMRDVKGEQIREVLLGNRASNEQSKKTISSLFKAWKKERPKNEK